MTGCDAAGGISGFSTGALKISESNNSGAVNATGEAGYAGGLAGQAGTVRIIASYSAGQITGNGAAGGLLGHDTGAYIVNSYSHGEPSGSGVLGGVAGTSSAQIINSYTTASVIAGAGGAPQIYNSYCLSEVSDEQEDSCTSAEMKTQAFAEVLRFAFAYREGTYPALHWEDEPSSDYVILNYAESTTYTLGGDIGLVEYEEADTQVKVSKTEGLPAEDPAPVNDNFQFSGWYLDAAYGEVCQSIEALDDSATVFAKWEINLAPVTVIIDYGCAYQAGSTATTEERSIAYGSVLEEPSIERTGYELLGWYEVLNPGTETETLADSKVDFSVPRLTGLMIRAVWQKTADPDFTWYTTAKESNEFHIDEAEELFALARLVSGVEVPAEVAEAAVSFAGAEIYLDADIDLTDLITDDAAQYYWTLPIGTTKDTAFEGHFHGQGNTISGLCIVTDETNQALFGYTIGAEIMNLCIEGTVEAGNYAALLVAYADGGLISGVEADGTVSTVISVASACSGGVIAYMTGGEVTGCTNRADVTAYSESASSSSVGGVIGKTTASTVNGCINEGTIRGAGTVGGVVGAGPVSIAISYCENHGDVEGGWRYGPGSATSSYVGGVAGNAYGVTYSVNTGDVTAYMLDSSSLTYVGGLTGWAYAGLYIYNYSEGDVLLESALVSVTENTAGAVGGLFGRDAASVQVVNCYSQGTVSSVLAEGSVGTPATMAGGLTGYNYGSTAYYVHCYSSGSLLPLLGQVTGENIVEDSYYLAAATGTGGARSDADMRTEAFAKELGFAYLYRSGDYPVLFWMREPAGDYIILNYSESKFYAYGSASGLVTREEPDTRVKVALPESGKLDDPETESTKTNFSFVGWFYQDGTEVNFETDVFTPGTEIYAEWVPFGITVYFQSDAGSEPVEVSVPYGYTAEPYPMDKEGYSLLGWRKISSLTETDPTGDYFDFENTIIMEDTYFRADWQREPVPAAYDWYSPGAAEYRISDAGDLIGLAKLVGGFQGSAEDFAGRTIVLDDDIALPEGYTWSIPIGRLESAPFRGNFDGNGHTISGLKIEDSIRDNQGLFGVVSGGSVENLTVAGEVTGNQNVGGIIGSIMNAKDSVRIAGVVNEVTVTGADCNVGGVIGYVDCPETVVSVTDAENRGEVVGAMYVGGISGRCDSTVTYADCINAASVDSDASVSGTSDGTAVYLGGITGYAKYIADANGTVMANLENRGSVTAASGTAIGGIAGYVTTRETGLTLQISGCKNAEKGQVNSPNGGIGGVFGTLACGTSESKFILEQCENEGTVKSSSTSPGTYIGGLIGTLSIPCGALTDCVNRESGTVEGPYAGGIIGRSTTGTTYDGENEDEVVVLTRCGNEGLVKATYSSGWAAGISPMGTTTQLVKMQECYNSGTVTGSGSVSGIAYGYATLEQCYNTGRVEGGSSGASGLMNTTLGGGSINQSYNAGTVYATGGVVTGVINSIIPTSPTTITDCYNIGEIIAEGTTASYVSGIGGGTGMGTATEALIISCYNAGKLTVTQPSSTVRIAPIYVTGFAGSYSIYNIENMMSGCYAVTGEGLYTSGGSEVLTDEEAAAAGAGLTLFGQDWYTTKENTALTSGELAYLLDGGSGTRRSVWTQDEANGYPVIGEPAYYALLVAEMGNENGTATITYEYQNGQHRSASSGGSYLYAPKGEHIEVSGEGWNTNTVEYYLSAATLNGEDVLDGFTVTGDGTVYVTFAVQKKEPQEPDSETETENETKATGASRATGGNASSAKAAEVIANTPVSKGDGSGLGDQSGDGPGDGTGTGEPSDTEGQGGDGAETTTSQNYSVGGDPAVDIPTTIVIAPQAATTEIAEGGVVPEGGTSQPEEPDILLDVPEPEPEEPVEEMQEPPAVMEMVDNNAITQNPALIAVLVGVILVILAVSIFFSARRKARK